MTHDKTSSLIHDVNSTIACVDPAYLCRMPVHMSNGGCTVQFDPLVLVEVAGVELEVAGACVQVRQRMTLCPRLDAAKHIFCFCCLYIEFVLNL